MMSKIRILALGDCNTSGAKSTAYSHNLPQSVCKLLSKNGVQCELQNLGYTMSTSREGVMRAKIQAKPADILLLNFGLVDAWVTSIPAIYISYYPNNKLKSLARKLLKSIKKRLQHPRIRKICPRGHVVNRDEFERNLATIIEEVKTVSPKVRLIMWGCPPTYNDLERNHHLAEYDKIMKGISDDFEGRFINTREILKEYLIEETYQDNVHLSLKGCDVIAAEIVTLIQDMK